MLKNFIPGLIAIAASVTLVGSAMAVQVVKTHSLTVEADVIATCTLTATTLHFEVLPGNIPMTGTSTVTANTSLDYNCNDSQVDYDISIAGGANQATTGAPGTVRRVRLGTTTNFMEYTLFQPTTTTNSTITTTEWGDNNVTIAGAVLPAPGTSSAQSVAIYGELTVSVGQAGGQYTDSVVISVLH